MSKKKNPSGIKSEQKKTRRKDGSKSPWFKDTTWLYKKKEPTQVGPVDSALLIDRQ